MKYLFIRTFAREGVEVDFIIINVDLEFIAYLEQAIAAQAQLKETVTGLEGLLLNDTRGRYYRWAGNLTEDEPDGIDELRETLLAEDWDMQDDLPTWLDAHTEVVRTGMDLVQVLGTSVCWVTSEHYNGDLIESQTIYNLAELRDAVTA